MKTTDFLKRKGLVKEGYTHFIIDTDEGRFTLNDLLEEYHKEQLNLNGVSRSKTSTDPNIR